MHNLNVEISDLKIELEKSALKLSQSEEKNNESGGFEQLDEETKTMLNELMQEIEDLKKEKNEISEKALNALTEKELENLEIREKLDMIQQEHHKEMNSILQKNHDMQIELNQREFKRNILSEVI